MPAGTARTGRPRPPIARPGLLGVQAGSGTGQAGLGLPGWEWGSDWGWDCHWNREWKADLVAPSSQRPFVLLCGSELLNLSEVRGRWDMTGPGPLGLAEARRAGHWVLPSVCLSQGAWLEENSQGAPPPSPQVPNLGLSEFWDQLCVLGLSS